MKIADAREIGANPKLYSSEERREAFVALDRSMCRVRHQNTNSDTQLAENLWQELLERTKQ